MFLPAVCFGMD